MLVCFNGKFGEEKDFSSVISPFSDSVQFGQAVFETLRTYYGDQVFAVEAHLDRLFQSAEILKLDLGNLIQSQDPPHSPLGKGGSNYLRDVIKSHLKELVEKNKISGKDLRIKIFLAEDFFWIRSQVPEEMSDEFYQQGVVINDTIFERTFPRAKWINPAYPYFQKVRPEGIFETICFSEKGRLREGTITNVFAVFGNTIITPQKNILLGVTRQKVLETAGRLGYHVAKREIFKKKLLEADEIFLTCTSKEVIPVWKWGEWENDDFEVALMLKKHFPRI